MEEEKKELEVVDGVYVDDIKVEYPDSVEIPGEGQIEEIEGFLEEGDE